MKKPYIVWNALEEMPAWPGRYETVAEALKAAEKKKEVYRSQGYYSADGGKYHIPFERLKVGVLWEDLSSEESSALHFYVVDTRKTKKKGGFIPRGRV